jgi:CRISPR-associated endonuclease/helicase Cas3
MLDRAPPVTSFFAHSGQRADKSDWQPLPDHLLQVAELASQHGEAFRASKAAHIAGLLHDLGKYNPAFQARLEGSNKRVDHSTAGAAEILLRTMGIDQIAAELIAYAILGHHAGLPDKLGAASSYDDRINGYQSRLDPTWLKELHPEWVGLMPQLQWNAHSPNRAFQLAFLGRMLFSCLVDADFKDTEEYYLRLQARTPDRQWQSLADLLPQFLRSFDRKMTGLSAKDTQVNRLRAKVLEHVRRRASHTPGLFTLTVPTGGGKTLASLGFALHHARAHGLRRIIYAIPFTSIIDQTAAVFRDILGEAHVLEHHSAIDDSKSVEEGKSGHSRKKMRLTMEDWAAPVVVTTNVQLFESLYTARPSRARKLHNIAGSIIILDEAQTIPLSLLSPAVRALEELTVNYNCSIVLCTATQPALGSEKFEPNHPAGLPLTGRELAPDPSELANSLKRVTLTYTGSLSNADLVKALSETPQSLVIVNSRRHALDLFRDTQAAGLNGLIHLTTRMVAAHRQEVLESVRECLKAQKPCRVIATSLIEAGVDVDFPRVWRAEAGLDQIAQAAGRCNREGRNPIEESLVSIFEAPDYPPPAEIKGLIGDRARMENKHVDLLSPAAIADYFEEVYWRKGKEGLDRHGILDAFVADGTGTQFAYRTVGETFRMIESGMAPVIVPYDEKALSEVVRIGVEVIPSGALARALQRYVVQVPPMARDLLIQNGHAQFEAPETRGDQFAVLKNMDLYRKDTGLIWELADYLSIESGIL